MSQPQQTQTRSNDDPIRSTLYLHVGGRSVTFKIRPTSPAEGSAILEVCDGKPNPAVSGWDYVDLFCDREQLEQLHATLGAFLNPPAPAEEPTLAEVMAAGAAQIGAD